MHGCIQQADVSVQELHRYGTHTILVELGPNLGRAVSAAGEIRGKVGRCKSEATDVLLTLP